MTQQEKPPPARRGRKLNFGAGQVVKKTVTLDEESIAIAATIHHELSSALRIALATWKEAHDEPATPP